VHSSRQLSRHFAKTQSRNAIRLIECASLQAYSGLVRFSFKEIAMQVPWFFATTPAPQRPLGLRPARRHRTPSLWVRLGERLIAWGEGARHHRLGSWLQH
jgi:hypothetical protein